MRNTKKMQSIIKRTGAKMLSITRQMSTSRKNTMKRNPENITKRSIMRKFL